MRFVARSSVRMKTMFGFFAGVTPPLDFAAGTLNIQPPNRIRLKTETNAQTFVSLFIPFTPLLLTKILDESFDPVPLLF